MRKIPYFLGIFGGAGESCHLLPQWGAGRLIEMVKNR
jgi:hypothetical protein